MLFGLVKPTWNPGFMPAVPSSLPEFEYMGGFGYGVTREDVIIGGFGLAFLDYDIYGAENWGSESSIGQHLAGGVGGLIVGSRVLGSSSIHLDIAARLGLGGMGMASISMKLNEYGAGYSYYEVKGYAIAYAEPYIELGIGLAPWMHFCATLSYPFIGNFVPGKPFDEVKYYTPALGCTISFGDFK